MTILYLVRHAHADWTPDENRPLSAVGRADALRVAEILMAYPIDAIYASPAARARQTIEPLAARLGRPVTLEPDLEERRLGDIRGQDFVAAVEATWRDPALAHPGGETNAAAQQRGLAVARRVWAEHPTGQVAVSTHGNLLALILQGFDPTIGFSYWRSLTMPDIYRLDVGPAGTATIRRLWSG